MAKVRFLGAEPNDVPELGRTVTPDELVEVSEELYRNRSWAESLWKKTPSKDKDKE